jgi:hypothetical protein
VLIPVDCSAKANLWLILETTVSVYKTNGIKRSCFKFSRRTKLINSIVISATNNEPVFHEFYNDREVASLALLLRLIMLPAKAVPMKGARGIAIVSVHLIRRRRGLQLP